MVRALVIVAAFAAIFAIGTSVSMLVSCTDGVTPDCSTIDSGCYAFDAGTDSAIDLEDASVDAQMNADSPSALDAPVD
jgi:hypothetical protein